VTIRNYEKYSEFYDDASLLRAAAVHYDNDNNDGNKSATSAFCLGHAAAARDDRESVSGHGREARERDREIIIRGDGATEQYLRRGADKSLQLGIPSNKTRPATDILPG